MARERVLVTAMAGHPRSRDNWLVPFRAAIQSELRSGSVVIDVGGGRHPAIARSDLPPGTTYIGLDLSERELMAAPLGSYDRVVVGDVVERQPYLEGCADLVVSWAVLEHMAPLGDAVFNIYQHLRPGGLFLAQLNGGRSAFALINGMIPHRLAKVATKRLLRRHPESVLPAPYDWCTYSALSQTLASCPCVRIVPRYRGAQFGFLPARQTLYVRIEDLIVWGDHRDPAAHYLVVARR